ncbi:hypothetical protein Tco_1355487, partial [Tanacetum coccineum]
QKKDVIQYPPFTKLIIADLMKKFPSISPRSKEDYHSIKDDIPLGSVYTTGNVTIRGMFIPGELLTDDIRATKEYKEYDKKFVRVDIPTFQQEPVESTQGTHRIPRATRTPTPTTEKKQKSREVAGDSSTPRKSLKIIIKQKQPSTTPIPHLSNDEEEDSHASAFVDSMLCDEEDTRTRIEPVSHKEHSEIFNEDDDDVVGMKTNDDDKEDENDDVVWSLGMSRCIHQFSHPLDPLGLRQDIMIKQMEKKFIASNATNEIIENNLSLVLVKEIMKERDTYQEIVPALISKEFADHAPKMIEELFQTYIQNNVITVHPATSSSTVIPSFADLQRPLYLKMKRSLQDRADDIDLWEVLRRKFENLSVTPTSCRTYTFCGTDHDDHQKDDAPLEGEKQSKSQKISSN